MVIENFVAILCIQRMGLSCVWGSLCIDRPTSFHITTQYIRYIHHHLYISNNIILFLLLFLIVISHYQSAFSIKIAHWWNNILILDSNFCRSLVLTICHELLNYTPQFPTSTRCIRHMYHHLLFQIIGKGLISPKYVFNTYHPTFITIISNIIFSSWYRNWGK